MKPILVLAPAAAGLPRRERPRIDLRRVAGDVGPVDPSGYSAVIVLNDGRAGTVGRLRRALALRQRDARLCVGVLTPLDPPRGAAVMAGPEPPELLLQALGPELRAELTGEVLCLEYQAA